MTMRSLLLGCLLLGAVGGAAACQAVDDAKREVGDQFEARRAVQGRVGSSPVTVTLLNGTTLKITIANSQLRDLPQPRKEAKAAELAKVAFEAYGGRARLTHVAVVFTVDLTLPVVHVTTEDSHTFDAARWR